MYQWWYTGILTLKNSFIFFTPLIKNSSLNMISKDVYNILGHCIPPEQNPDQMFG